MEIAISHSTCPEFIKNILSVMYAGKWTRKFPEEYTNLFPDSFLEIDDALNVTKRLSFAIHTPFLPILDELVNAINDNADEREEVATTYDGPLTFSKAKYWLRRKAIKTFIPLYLCAYFIEFMEFHDLFDHSPSEEWEMSRSPAALWSILTGPGNIMKRRASLFEPCISKGHIVTRLTLELMDHICLEISKASS